MDKLSKDIILKSNSWGNFNSNISDLSESEQGKVFENLCLYFFKVEPKFKILVDKIWNTKESESIPIEIKEYINLPDTDEGIDYIIQTKQGKIWSVQSKFHTNPEKNILRKELGTFYDSSFRTCKNIEFAITITNARGYSYKFEKLTSSEKENNISFITSDALEKLDFKEIEYLILNKKYKFEKKIKAEHQLLALKKLDFFVQNKKGRGQIIHPCGTGKSLTAFWFSEKYRNKYIIVAVPSLALLNQTLDVWAKESIALNWDNNFIVVCSDEKAAKTSDNFISTRLEFGVKCTDDIDEISSFLVSKKIKNSKVVLTTYQSSLKVCQAFKNSNLKCDLAILDEAHRTVGNKSKLFTKLLFNENIHIKKRLFFTATPKIYNGKSEKFFGMEDESIYGEIIDELKFTDALKYKRPDGKNILCDYNIVTFVCSNNEVIKLIGKNKFLELTNIKGNVIDEVESHLLASSIGLRKLKSSTKSKKTITFHNRLERAESFSKKQDFFNDELGKVDSFFIKGAFNTKKKKNILELFQRSSNSIISNAKCLNEGVDIDSVDSILFADPRDSTVDIVQACGRAMRPHKDKTVGYIFIPIFLNDEGIQSEKMRESFKEVIRVVNQIGTMDERLVEYYKTISIGKKWRGRKIIDFVNFTESTPQDFSKFIEDISIHISYRIQGLKMLPIDEKKLLKFFDEFHEENNEYPNQRKYREEKYYDGTTMKSIDSALHLGNRGLKAYGNITEFLIFHKRIKRAEEKIELSVKLVLSWIDEYFKNNKKYPSAHSGAIKGTNENWFNVNTCGRVGVRGLKKGESIAQLITKYRTKKINWLTTNYYLEDIKNWIQEYFDKFKVYPNSTNKNIKDRPTWGAIHNSLKKGKRDINDKKGKFIIEPGSSLSEFIEKEFGHKKFVLTINIINEILDYDYKTFKSYPNYNKFTKVNHPEYKNIKTNNVVLNWDIIQRNLVEKKVTKEKLYLSDLLKDRNWNFNTNSPFITEQLFFDLLKKEIIDNQNLPTARDTEHKIDNFYQKTWGTLHKELQKKIFSQNKNILFASLRGLKVICLKQVMDELKKPLSKILKKDVYESLKKSQAYNDLDKINY